MNASPFAFHTAIDSASQVAAEETEGQSGRVLEQFALICDALIDTLVDAQDLKGFVSVSSPHTSLNILNSLR